MRKNSKSIFPYFLFCIFMLTMNVFLSFSVDADIVVLNEDEMKLIWGGNPSQMCPSICTGTETSCNGCGLPCGGPAWEYPNPNTRGCSGGGSQTCIKGSFVVCSKEYTCGWTGTTAKADCLFWWRCFPYLDIMCVVCGKLANPIVSNVYNFSCN